MAGFLRAGQVGDGPHPALTTRTRYLIVDAEQADVTEYGSTMQAYTDEQLRKMLEAAGMSNVRGIEESDWPAGEGLTDKLRVFACEKALS